jgi:hypothetical protein
VPSGDKQLTARELLTILTPIAAISGVAAVLARLDDHCNPLISV